jgi:hypothetical protein
LPATRLIALNNNAGAYVAIVSTIPSRRVFIREDESVAAAQGLQYQKPEDGFVQAFVVGTPGAPDQAQIALPDAGGVLSVIGRLLGMPVQNGVGNFNSRAADTYIKIKSKTATVTSVRVLEAE